MGVEVARGAQGERVAGGGHLLADPDDEVLPRRGVPGLHGDGAAGVFEDFGDPGCPSLVGAGVRDEEVHAAGVGARAVGARAAGVGVGPVRPRNHADRLSDPQACHPWSRSSAALVGIPCLLDCRPQLSSTRRGRPGDGASGGRRRPTNGQGNTAWCTGARVHGCTNPRDLRVRVLGGFAQGFFDACSARVRCHPARGRGTASFRRPLDPSPDVVPVVRRGWLGRAASTAAS
jgi:hypothetical protein